MADTTTWRRWLWWSRWPEFDPMKRFFLWTGVILLLVPGMICCWWAYPNWVVSAFVWRHPAGELRTYIMDLKDADQTDFDFWADKGHWKAGFTGCGVIKVSPYIEGVLIHLYSRLGYDYGVFVSNQKEGDMAPEDGSGISFEKIGEGVFSYVEKEREAYIKGPR